MKERSPTLLIWFVFIITVFAALVIGSVLVGDDDLPAEKKDPKLEKLKREIELREKMNPMLSKEERTEAELKAMRARAALNGLELPERIKEKDSDPLAPGPHADAPGSGFGASPSGLSRNAPLGELSPSADESALNLVNDRILNIFIKELNGKRELLVPSGEFANGIQPGFELLLGHFRTLSEEGIISTDALARLESGEIEVIYGHAEGHGKLQVSDIRIGDSTPTEK